MDDARGNWTDAVLTLPGGLSYVSYEVHLWHSTLYCTVHSLIRPLFWFFTVDGLSDAASSS